MSWVKAGANHPAHRYVVAITDKTPTTSPSTNVPTVAHGEAETSTSATDPLNSEVGDCPPDVRGVSCTEENIEKENTGGEN
jgi:hypothetical protein